MFYQSSLLVDYLFIFLNLLVLAVVIFLVILVGRKILHSLTRLAVSFKKEIFLVTLPKEAAEKGADKDNREQTVQALQEKIGVAETFFSSLGGLKTPRSLRAFLFGREDHFSLEIVAHQSLISFYLAVPSNLARYLEQQIHAQYPEAQIEPVDDYNIFRAQGEILGTYLVFKRAYIFPIKTYRKFEADPLNSLTNILSKITTDEGAAIQIIARSAHRRWHRWGTKVARELQSGKKMPAALKAARASKFLEVLGRWTTALVDTFRTKEERERIEEKSRESYKLSPMEEEAIKGLEEKTSKSGFDVNIRLVVSAPTEDQAEMYLDNLANSFAQFNIYEYGNSFKRSAPLSTKKLINDFIYRNYNPKKRLLLNTEEITSLYHFPLPTTETPNIRWLVAKRAAAPVNMPTQGLILGKNIYRGRETVVRIKRGDRCRHVYIIGMTGTGKSTLLEEMIKQDMQNGEGVGVIDPHGSLVENILPCVPKERVDDVIYFDPSDVDRPIGLNMLEANTPEQMDFAVQEMIAIFYKLVTDPNMIGPMFEHNMRNAMLTLMADKEYPGTIADIPRIFTDSDFQKYKLKKVKNPIVRAFWEKEMAKTSDFHKSEMLGYLISKVGRFVENEMIRNIIGQPKSGFSFREAMDKKKILLINLSKGKIGEMNANLLGLIAVSKLQMAALARADIPAEERHDFYLYIDEFQNFITDSIATILAEARKYKLNLIIAHQYIGQLVQGQGQIQDTKVREAVFGNVGTIMAFKIGVDDAEIMAKQFAPVFNGYDVINIEKYNAYVRLLIDNTAARPFNMAAFPPTFGDPRIAASIKELSRLKYGRDRSLVEAEILERTKLGEAVSQSTDSEIERTL